METIEPTPGGSRRAVAGGAAVAAAGLLAALALVFTNATGVTEVAADARLQQQIESALGATAAARNSLGQAILVVGAVDDSRVGAATVVEAHLVIDSLEQRVAAVSGLLSDPSELDAALDGVVESTRETLAALSEGDLDRAGSLAAGPTDAAYDELVDALSTLRQAVAARIAAADNESSTVATASRFMVAFFVPSAAVVIGVLAMRRRRKREQLAIALEQERALNRSKDQLIANLSHELRTPLTGIYTAALALEDTGYSEPSLSSELNGMIIDQSADLTRMVEDLLVSAQADAGRLRFDLEPTTVAEIVESMVPEFTRLGADIELEVDPAHVLADPGRLRQVLRNLLSNAVRYGGDSIRVEGVTDGHTYRLTVSDDGPGLPSEIEDRLFERFVHEGDTPLVVGSVGLGLAITRVLTEGMMGEISYARRDGWTCFELDLRREPDPDAEMPPDPEPHEGPALLADDEEPVVEAHDPGSEPESAATDDNRA